MEEKYSLSVSKSNQVNKFCNPFFISFIRLLFTFIIFLSYYYECNRARNETVEPIMQKTKLSNCENKCIPLHNK